METWVAKVITIVITFIIPFVFTMIPCAVHGFIAKQGKTGERAIGYLMCFGGGIFFGTFLLHMGPEVRLILETFLLGPNEIIYPVTDLVIGAGFFFVLLLEKIVMRINKRRTEKAKSKLEHNCLWYQNEVARRGSDSDKNIKICYNCAHEKPCLGMTAAGFTKMEKMAADTSMTNKNSTMTSSAVELTEFRLSSNGNNGCLEHYGTDSTNNHMSPADSSHHHGHHHDHQDDDDETNHHNMRSMILVLALSLHHLFEGLTVGLQKSISLLVTLVIAIMCHEAIISFSVGLNFVKCKYSLKKHFLTALLVSLIMPIGEAVGIVMSELGSQSIALEIASGFLQAFSAGTFLYVTFFEIFQEEISPHDTSIGKIASAFTGFVVMALLMLMVPPPINPEVEPEHNHTATIATIAAWM